jgi:hypothetical protein
MGISLMADVKHELVRRGVIYIVKTNHQLYGSQT